VTILRLAGGPPTSKPINIKVRGDDLDVIRAAAEDLKSFLNGHDAITDVSDDSPSGQREYTLRMDTDAVRKAGFQPPVIARTVGLLVDGEVAATMQDRGEEVELRVRAQRGAYQSPDELLRFALPARFRRARAAGYAAARGESPRSSEHSAFQFPARHYRGSRH
jgi:multidrug efflux pump subunit AcrB